MNKKCYCLTLQYSYTGRILKKNPQWRTNNHTQSKNEAWKANTVSSCTVHNVCVCVPVHLFWPVSQQVLQSNPASCFNTSTPWGEQNTLSHTWHLTSNIVSATPEARPLTLVSEYSRLGSWVLFEIPFNTEAAEFSCGELKQLQSRTTAEQKHPNALNGESWSWV